ncbi:MerR family transcriptional regulator [Dactylosporangium sp. CS-033363]|uniref:helix-turn-helix domain-containing protein n=1 Tax=Dactylosporangium sp. CS-033363 TaxID=3239935 RepID=UPI003D90EAAB
MTAEEWTLEELIGRVAEQLDDTAYAGAPNGRVRDVPDARAVRWYTTIGLVDRPAMRGRTAWYGPRHLAQLVAIKRLQSEGYKIAEIQAELAEAPDDVLQDIAALDRPKGMPRRFWTQRPAEYVPEEAAPAPVEIVPGAGPVDAEPAPPGRGRREPGPAGRERREPGPAGGAAGGGQVPVGSAPPGEVPAGSAPPGQVNAGSAPPGEAPAGSAPEGEVPVGSAPPGHALPGPGSTGSMPDTGAGQTEPAPPGRKQPKGPARGAPGGRPVDANPTRPPGHGWPEMTSPGYGWPELTAPGNERPESTPPGHGRSEPAATGHGWPESRPAALGLLSGVPLGGGAVLLLNTTPNEDDLEAIRHAARELMDLLATRGLVTPDETMTRRGNAT